MGNTQILKHFVYVDDDQDDRFFFEEAISDMAIRLTLFSSARDLLCWHGVTALNTDTTVVFIDINMPKMNGYELLQAIRSHPYISGIPVVMLTTSNSPSCREKCMELGAMHFLTKQNSMAALKASLQSVVDQLNHKEGI